MNRSLLLAPVSVAAILLCWEFFGARSTEVRILISSPSRVAQYFAENPVPLFTATLTTFQESALGFLIAIGVALFLFALCLKIDGLLKVILPVMISSQVVPLVVLAPFFTIALGYGLASKTAMAALLCFFPIFMGFVQGYRVIPQTIHDLLSVHEARSAYRIFHVYLPMSLPAGMAGLKVGATLAVIGAIVAEFSGAQSGLGKNLFLASVQLQPELMMSSIILSSLMGAFLFVCVRNTERVLGKWYIDGSESAL